MDSRSQILAKLAAAKRDNSVLPDVAAFDLEGARAIEKFRATLTALGGVIIEVETTHGVNEFILQHYPPGSRIVSMLNEVNGEKFSAGMLSHSFETVDLFVMNSHFGVAENGAVWVTSELMGDRVLPFICQHLAIILKRNHIVETMHQAYARIGLNDYDFGTFIAGPSKTADIEQSLVLGAHGPKTLTVFLIN
jgi:L-lactate dehydrogenase complex protein LldG